MAFITINDLNPEASPTETDQLAIDGASMRRASVKDVVEIGRPAADQATAEAGADNTKTMTPLRVKQAIDAQALTKTGNLSGLSDVVAARNNLGLGTASISDVSSFATAAQGATADAALQPTGNLAGLANTATARSNLGLGSAATQNTTAFLSSGADSVSQTNMQDNSIGTNEIIAKSVTNAKMADMPANTIKGRLTAGTGVPEDVPASNILALVQAVSYGSAQTLTATQQAQARANVAAQGNLARVTVLTASGTHTTLANCTRMVVELVGGGGGGGGAAAATSIPRAGGGGGGGGYTLLEITSPAVSYAAVVGTGGAGGTVGGDGSAGGNTTFGGATANGGGGGLGSGTTNNNDTQVYSGGVGGTGSGGKFQIRGCPGTTGYKLSTATRAAGDGGSGIYGSGGSGPIAASLAGTFAGTDGSGYGGGGSGAVGSNASANAGGAGANGVIIIWEYI